VRARVAASAGLMALVAVALAGCNFFTPQSTQVPYDPSDGVSAQVGDVHVLNAVIVSEDGDSGNLLFSAVNSGSDDVALTLQFESDGEKITLDVDVPAGTTGAFGYGESGQLFLAGIDTQPGGLLPVYFQYGDEQGRQLLVPVLGGELEQYQGFLPSPTPTPTPTPTETAAPTPTATPTP
jgi:hypothetical protein